MLRSKIIVSILSVSGMILLCCFLTPFIRNDNGELVHSNIFFVGKLIVGRFLIYVALLMAVCTGVALIGARKNPG